MSKILRPIFILITSFAMTGSLLAQVSESERQRALDMSCQIAKASIQGSAPVSQTFYDLATRFPEAQRKALTVQMDGQLSKFSFMDSVVHEVANLEGMVIDHVVSSRSENRGTVYFRMRYEPYGQKMTLVNFAFNSDFKKIIATPFAQPPKFVFCPK